ncbi:MAG TPA: Gfo/Idh/MocA family oxidoreductase [Opitutaceae bacterium]|jgi:predicted dehydrogenase
MSTSPFLARPRVALIGVSGYGNVYYTMLLEMHQQGKIQLTAVTIIDPGKETAIVAALTALGCEIFEDFRLMLERHRGRLELCAIPTGIPWHTPMTLAALAAGAHVLVEKPLAATVEEVEEIRAAESRHGRTVMVGFQYHYVEANQQLKRLLNAGEIGRLRRIRIIGLWPRGAEYYHRTDWAGRVKSGATWVYDSPFSNAFAHHLSLALYFAGPAPAASASPVRVAAEFYRAQPIENFDTGALRAETNTGVAIHFYASHSCSSNCDPEIVIEGERGTVTWLHNQHYVVAADGAVPRQVSLGHELAARQQMFHDVFARLAGAPVFVCGTDIAREHTRCIQAAQSAAAPRDIPRVWLKDNGLAGPHRRIWIAGVEESLRRAFDSAQSLSQAGCAWAVAPAEILVSQLDRTGAGVPSPVSK